MIPVLTTLSVVLALVIVAVVAWHLLGILIALKRGADHLEALAGGLVKIRDDTRPLNERIDSINGGLVTLVKPLAGANDNLAAIVDVAERLRQ